MVAIEFRITCSETTGIRASFPTENELNACDHKDSPFGGRVCRHLLTEEHSNSVRSFTGKGIEFDLICDPCAKESERLAANLIDVCEDCLDEVKGNCEPLQFIGSPEVRIRSTGMFFQHETIDFPSLTAVDVLDIQPNEAAKEMWLAYSKSGQLIEIDAARRTTRIIGTFPIEPLSEQRQKLGRKPRVVLRISRDGAMAAIAGAYGKHGVVLDLASGLVTMKLERDGYHHDVSIFPIAFCEVDGRTIVIHGTAWNRLDASDAKTGELLTPRGPTSRTSAADTPPHHLDYFHSGLSVSPSQAFIVDDGWHWHPVGNVTTWSLPRWLHENVWESEDGKSRRSLCYRYYLWNAPLCWIDDFQLAVWGYGDDEEWMVPAALVFDVRTGEQIRWFAGPLGTLVFDEYLFSFDEKAGMAVWDVVTGERLMTDQEFCPIAYHRAAKLFVTLVSEGRMRVSRLVER